LRTNIEQYNGWVSFTEGKRIPYTLYRMPCRKRVHLVISDEGCLQVRAPHRFTPLDAESALYASSAWILEALGRARTSHATRPPLGTGARLSLLDESLRLVVIQESKPSVTREGELLRVSLPTITEQAIRASLEHWYRQQAKSYLTARLVTLAGDVGAYPTRVSIRAQKTRWGSCSGTGRISLNWRLMLLPAQLTDYVIVHELCHLEHLNHSPKFWALVKRIIPDCKERRARLVKVRRTLVL